MFHPALLKLIGLQWKGGFRQFRRSLRTFRGLFQLGFVIAMLAYGGLSMYFAGRFANQSVPLGGLFDKLQTDFMALGLFVLTSYILVFSTGEAMVYFTPSEVAFLFPAPLTRKQLLSFKLLKSLTGIISVAIIFSCLSMGQIWMMFPRFLGVLLTVSFLQLLTMNVAFTRQVLQEKLHLVVRRSLGIGLVVLAFIAVSQMIEAAPNANVNDYMNAFRESTTGAWLLAPFQPFVRLLRAPDMPTFLPHFSIVLVIDGLLLWLVFHLDGLSLEAALATSEKLANRLKQMQSKGVWQALSGSTTTAVAAQRMHDWPKFAALGDTLPVEIRASPRLRVPTGRVEYARRGGSR